MTQLEAFAPRIVDYQPFSMNSTAHARGTAVADDGNRYIVKGMDGQKSICATEWICASIANMLNVPVPEHKALRNLNGEILYGSRDIGNRLTVLEANKILYSGVPSNDLSTPLLATILSKIYALDLLLGNDDRHIENFIFTRELSDEHPLQIARIRAIDFGASTITDIEKSPSILDPRCNTIKIAREIRKSHTFENQPAISLCTRFRDNRELMLTNAMYDLPRDWMSDNERDKVFAYIMSNQFDAHMYNVERGLSNGTYL